MKLWLLRSASAACCSYHYSPRSGHGGGTRTREHMVLRTRPFAAWVRREKYTAAQVTRYEKTSLVAIRSDRGLSVWWSRRELHPRRAD